MGADSRHTHVITLIADPARHPLDEGAIAAVRTKIGGGAEKMLSPREAVDIPCADPDERGVSLAGLRAILEPFKADALLTRAKGRRKDVFTCDMDSTAVEGETPKAIARLRGKEAKCDEIGRLSRERGDDFAMGMRRRATLMTGTTEDELKVVLDDIRRAPGLADVVRTMRAHGALTAIVSGGFTWFADKVAVDLGFHRVYANVLEIKDGKLTGRLREPVLGPEDKVRALRELCAERGVGLENALATGDGGNDIQMLQAAGLGIAFHGGEKLRSVVSNQINFTGMRSLLFAQGYTASEIIRN